MRSIRTVDAHAEGEPLRVVLDGLPEVKGSSVLEYRRFVQSEHDHIRTALMWEPRGHADMYGCFVLPPVSDDAHFSVVFMHNEGYSTMCGHGVIAVAKVAIAEGLVEISLPVTTVRIDSPAGRVTAHANIDGEKVGIVSFDNVASFVEELGGAVEVPGLGVVSFDLAFGGAYYAYVDAESVGLSLSVDSTKDLIDAGMAVKRAVAASRDIRHPDEEDLGFLYGTIFVGPPHDPRHHSRNVCVFAEGEVDRSPTGTGVSGRLAIHHARGEIEVGERIVIESLIGSTFACEIRDTAMVGSVPAVLPRIEGRAFITGRHEFVVDPDDPFRDGFLLR